MILPGWWVLGSWVLHHLLKGRGQNRGVGTNTQRGLLGKGGCMGSQGHPGLPSCSGLSLWAAVRMVSPGLLLMHGLPSRFSPKAPPPGSIPSCQQDHTCHLLQPLQVFPKMQFFIDSLYLLSRATAPWSASWGLPAFQRCGYNR